MYNISPELLGSRISRAEAGGLFDIESKETAEAQTAIDQFNRAIDRIPGVGDALQTQKTFSELLADPSQKLIEIGQAEAPLIGGALPVVISEPGVSEIFSVAAAFVKTAIPGIGPPISPGEAKIVLGTFWSGGCDNRWCGGSARD